MPNINVRIDWDVPDEPQWLNRFNIELALAAFCRNTAFTVTQLNGKHAVDMAYEAAKGATRTACAIRAYEKMAELDMEEDICSSVVKAIIDLGEEKP